MWHFGRDSFTEYTGEKFSISVQNARHMIARIYSKEFNRKRRIRIERQEYPKKKVFDAINEKLGMTIDV